MSDRASSYTVGVVGPDTYLNVTNDALAMGSANNPATFLAALLNFRDRVNALGGEFALSRTEEVVRGCILDQNPACQEILIRDGFKVVHSGGGFPGPVLVIVTDHANYRTYFGTYAFFPN